MTQQREVLFVYLLIVLVFSITAVSVDASATNQTCDDCWGRGELVSANSAHCECRCNDAQEQMVNENAVKQRRFNVSSGRLRLLGPNCHYAIVEAITIEVEMDVSPDAVVSEIFARDIRSALVMKNDDQVVIHWVVSRDGGRKSKVIFDIREDGTGHNYTTRQLLIITPLNLHFLNLQDSLRFNPPPAWVQKYKITSLVRQTKGAAPTVKPSPVLGHVGGRPVYLETTIVVGCALLFTCMLALIEASLTTNFVPDEEEMKLAHMLAKKKDRKSFIAFQDPDEDGEGAAGGGGKKRRPSKEAWAEDDEDSLSTVSPEDQPVSKKPSNLQRRRSSVADAHDQEAHPPLERQQSNVSKKYFLG